MAIQKTKSSAPKKDRKVLIAPSKEKMFDVIPVSPESFFTELGYALSSWKGQKTRMENKLDINVGTRISPKQAFLILEAISKSTSKNKTKAKEWLSVIKELPEEELKEVTNVSLLDIDEGLLKEYDVSLEDVTTKHNLMKVKDDYVKELDHRISVYRFKYDIAICKLLKKLYEDGIRFS